MALHDFYIFFVSFLVSISIEFRHAFTAFSQSATALIIDVNHPLSVSLISQEINFQIINRIVVHLHPIRICCNFFWNFNEIKKQIRQTEAANILNGKSYAIDICVQKCSERANEQKKLPTFPAQIWSIDHDKIDGNNFILYFIFFFHFVSASTNTAMHYVNFNDFISHECKNKIKNKNIVFTIKTKIWRKKKSTFFLVLTNEEKLPSKI